MSATLRMWLALLVVGALTLTLAACGGGDDDDGDPEPTDAVTEPADGDDDGAGGELEAFEETYPVDQTFWHQGFMVEVTDAVHAGTEPDVFDEQELSLTINADFTNEGDDTGTLRSNVTLVTDGGTYQPSFGTEIPNLPGGVTVTGAWVFRVDEDFDIDSAYLLVGGGNEQQAQVPIGADGGELVSLEPSDVPITGTITNSLIDINVTSGALRADDPINHVQMEAESLALTINFDVTSRRSGNWSIFAEEFTLTLPDGSNVAPDGALLPSLAGSDAGIDTPDLYVRFVVDDPPAGDYVFNFNPSDRFYGEGEPTQYTIEFTLE